MLVGQTWVIVETIMDTLLLVVKQCVLNQIQGYWLLLLDAFIFVFNLCSVLKVGVASIESLNQPLIYGDFDLELQEFK
jgi:hypothetical protein